MNNNPNQPRDYDAVLGGQTPPPVTGVVLGGIEGVKRRLASPIVEARIAALSEALKYGEAGLDLAIEALQDNSLQVQRSAFLILRERLNNKVRQALLDYDPWQFFTTLDNWKQKEFNPQSGIIDPVGTAYVVNVEQLKLLLQDSQASQVEALICQMLDNKWRYEFSPEYKSFADLLFDAHKQLTNLKALFVGDIEEHEYRKSRLGLGNFSLIGEDYPNLEVLQVRGFCGDTKLTSLQHDKLKTLIVETADISDQNIAHICASDLPALEYFELWMGRDYNQPPDAILDSLKPIIFDDSFPNLTYLGLRSSEYSDLLAEALVQSPVIEHLAVLDLSMGNLTDEGAEALLNCSAINQLHTLNITNNCVSSETIKQLYELGCWVIADSQEDFYERGGASRYYALYE